jgi:hypothetical protein
VAPGSDEAELVPPGSVEARPVPPGSDEVEPMLWGLDEAAVMSLNDPSELIIDDHCSPSLGTLTSILDRQSYISTFLGKEVW